MQINTWDTLLKGLNHLGVNPDRFYDLKDKFMSNPLSEERVNSVLSGLDSHINMRPEITSTEIHSIVEDIINSSSNSISSTGGISSKKRRLASLNRKLQALGGFYEQNVPGYGKSMDYTGVDSFASFVEVISSFIEDIHKITNNGSIDLYDLSNDNLDKITGNLNDIIKWAKHTKAVMSGKEYSGRSYKKEPDEFRADDRQESRLRYEDKRDSLAANYKSKINKKAGYWEEDSEAAEVSGKKTLFNKVGDPKKINQAWATPEGNAEFFNKVNELKNELEEARKNNLKKTDIGYESDPEAYEIYLAKKDEYYNFLAQYPFKEECNKCWGQGGTWGHGDFFGCEHCDETGYMFPDLAAINKNKQYDLDEEASRKEHQLWKEKKREDLEMRLGPEEIYGDRGDDNNFESDEVEEDEKD